MELDRLVQGEPLMGARAGDQQVADGPRPDVLALGRVRPGLAVGALLDREPEVLPDQAGELRFGIIRDALQPCPDRGMGAGPVGAGHRAVRRVAKKGVLEAQLDLARQARGRPSEDQPALGEASQRLADVGGAERAPDRALRRRRGRRPRPPGGRAARRGAGSRSGPRGPPGSSPGSAAGRPRSGAGQSPRGNRGCLRPAPRRSPGAPRGSTWSGGGGRRGRAIHSCRAAPPGSS